MVRAGLFRIGHLAGHRINANKPSLPTFVFKSDLAGNFCEQSVVFAKTNILTRLKPRPTLPNQNGTT